MTPRVGFIEAFSKFFNIKLTKKTLLSISEVFGKFFNIKLTKKNLTELPP
jgi:hypothetical protein